MTWDRDRLRAALASPRTEAARDAALALGATGTLDDAALLEDARADARAYYAETVARRSRAAGAPGCGTAVVLRQNQAWSESVGPFEEGLALLHARLHPDGGIAALASEGCTVSLLATHIKLRDDLDLFVRLLAVLSRDHGTAFAAALRELTELAGYSHPSWSRRAAIAVGAWCPRERIAELDERWAAACDLAGVYGWRPDERRRANLLTIMLAFGRARFGGDALRFVFPAVAAITSVVDARIARLLDAQLAEAPASAGRDHLRAALQRRA